MKRVGIIGWPLGHSLSPTMQNAAFRALGMSDWRYDRLPIPPDHLRNHLNTLRDQGGYLGLNVTLPLKEAVLPFIEADAKAAAVGAVNTIDFRKNQGSNTDIDGLLADLAAHEIPLLGRRALVLGAGGAARAAVYALAGAGAQLAIWNRNPRRAARLIAQLGVKAETLSITKAADWQPQLLVNCTSLGMAQAGDENRASASPWPKELPLPSDLILYDLVYRPKQTALMRQVERAGGRAIGGLGMLVRQGGLSFQQWTGREAPLDIMRAAAERELLGVATNGLGK